MAQTARDPEQDSVGGGGGECCVKEKILEQCSVCVCVCVCVYVCVCVCVCV